MPIKIYCIMGGNNSKGNKNTEGLKNGRTKSLDQNKQQRGGNPYVGPPSIPPECQHKSTVRVLKAIYDYEPMQKDDMGFKKGDKLQVIDDTTYNDWWFALHLGSKREGYVPSNYVVEDSDAPEAQFWWFSIDRREANKQLMIGENPSGTFLIRNSADLNSFALSVRVLESGVFKIKHYKIKRQGDEVYIAERLKFESLLKLVEHYRENVDGLCSKLLYPCPRETEPVPFKSLEVDRKEIKRLNKLGAGQFGEVFKARYRTAFVAVKTLKGESMTVDAFLDEAKIMHKLRHRKLVQLMGICTEMEPVYIITEFMENGALLEYLRKNKTTESLTFLVLVDMAAQIADGMAYLEAQNPPFIHRDLRAANILVGANNSVKVADFGLARILQGEDEIYTSGEQSKFPVKWTAPEAVLEHTFSVKSDVWSYGVLLYEIVTLGRVPYPGMDACTVVASISSGYRMPRPQDRSVECPEKLYEVMLRCWDHSPENRPTFVYLFRFFDDYATETEEHYRPPEGE